MPRLIIETQFAIFYQTTHYPALKDLTPKTTITAGAVLETTTAMHQY